MAEEEPLLVSPPTQDTAVHVRDYLRFTKLLKWSFLTCLVVALLWTATILTLYALAPG